MVMTLRCSVRVVPLLPAEARGMLAVRGEGRLGFGEGRCDGGDIGLPSFPGFYVVKGNLPFGGFVCLPLWEVLGQSGRVVAPCGPMLVAICDITIGLLEVLDALMDGLKLFVTVGDSRQGFMVKALLALEDFSGLLVYAVYVLILMGLSVEGEDLGMSAVALREVRKEFGMTLIELVVMLNLVREGGCRGRYRRKVRNGC